MELANREKTCKPLVSLMLNIGLISGYVRIAKPETHAAQGYLEAQREQMTKLMEEGK